MRITFTALAFVGAASFAAAQTPAPSPAPAASPSPAASAAPAVAAAPAPAPELQKLAFLAGDWVHEETYSAGPMGAGSQGKARSKAAWVLGNQHLYVIYAAKSPTAQIEGRAFLGFDPRSRQYYMDWYDSMGAATRYAGDFDATGALVLNADVTMDGRATRAQFTIKPQPDGKVLFTNAMAGPDGAMKTVFESRATAEKK
jgi:hypothetical protein